jgi:prepilin-type N-terminal cleavage/methylation domain-containing protein
MRRPPTTRRRIRRPAGTAPDRSGFTLVEILVVLMIITIGIVPLAVVQTRARHEVSKSDDLTQAIVLAQNRLEQAKSLGFGNVAADSGQAGRLRWVMTVQNTSFGLDEIGVRVTWFDGRSEQTLRMASLMSVR